METPKNPRGLEMKKIYKNRTHITFTGEYSEVPAFGLGPHLQGSFKDIFSI